MLVMGMSYDNWRHVHDILALAFKTQERNNEVFDILSWYHIIWESIKSNGWFSGDHSEIELTIEAGIFGGHPREYHGSNKGTIKVMSDITTNELKSRITTQLGESVNLKDLNADNTTLKDAGLKNGSVVQVTYRGRMD